MDRGAGPRPARRHHGPGRTPRGRCLRHDLGARRRGPGRPGPGVDVVGVLPARPRVALHLRQLRGRAAAGPGPCPAAGREHLGSLPRGGRQHVRDPLPRGSRHRRSGVVRGVLPRPAGRLVRGPRLALAGGTRRLLPRHLRASCHAGRAGPVRTPPRAARIGLRGPRRHARPVRGRQPARDPAGPRARRLVPGDAGGGPAGRRLAPGPARRRLGPHRRDADRDADASTPRCASAR